MLRRRSIGRRRHAAIAAIAALITHSVVVGQLILIDRLAAAGREEQAHAEVLDPHDRLHSTIWATRDRSAPTRALPAVAYGLITDSRAIEEFFQGARSTGAETFRPLATVRRVR